MEFLISIIIVIFVIIWYRRMNKHDIPKKQIQHTDLSMPEYSKYDLEEYVKKPFIFDTHSEFNLLPLLQEVLGSEYYVFPQINYSHLIKSRTGSPYEDRRYRSHIDRRSADFVICDKACVPILVIDLDGGVHNTPHVHEKDIEIDEILTAIGLPIIRLTNEDSENKELVRMKISAILNLF